MEERCEGITKKGTRCAITPESRLTDEQGRLISDPLCLGGRFCRIHARPFAKRPAKATGKALIVFLDFETTGLDVTRNEIVEIGAFEAESGQAFASVVSAKAVPSGTAVHGIDPKEIEKGPRFPEVWRRFVAWADGLINSAVEELSDSSQEERRPHATLAIEPPSLVLAAHNGYRFDFPLLLFECQRHGISWAPLKRWLFADTYEILQATGAPGNCLKLQCLGQASPQVLGLRAHRALDDCVTLCAVMQNIACRWGPNLWSIMKNFVTELDDVESFAQVAALMD